MRQLLALILSLVGSCAAFAQTTPDSRESVTNKRIAVAEDTLQRTREMVEAGVLARVRLRQAEEELADAHDDAILDRTLYGSTGAADWNDQLTEQMLAAAQRRVDRQQERIETARKVVAAGVAVPMYLTPFEAELTTRQLTLDLARSRARLMDETVALVKFEQAVAEAEAEAEASSALADEDGGVLTVTGMEHYEGAGVFEESRDLAPLASAFAARFEHPLPISADGETDLHRALGFDHRGRVDVALNPSDPEGVWLRRYLKSRKIPYYAFTHAFPGRATAAHVHIGPGSTRLRATD